jgi:hypothetical protein
MTGPLRAFLAGQLANATNGAGRVEIDEADPDGQTLLLWYPEVEPRDGSKPRDVAVRLTNEGHRTAAGAPWTPRLVHFLLGLVFLRKIGVAEKSGRRRRHRRGARNRARRP